MAEKKRILIVSYYFAPQNVIGAVRPTKLAKYLTRMGHEVTVISGGGLDGLNDPTLERDLQELKDVRLCKEWSPLRDWYIYKAAKKQAAPAAAPSAPAAAEETAQPSALKKLVKNAVNAVYVYLDWFADRNFCRLAKRELKKLNGTYDVVFSTYASYAVHEVSQLAKKKGLAKKWFADFRDEVGMPFACQEKRKQRYLQMIRRDADIVSAVSQGFLEMMNFDDIGRVLSNGFDREDIPQVDAAPCGNELRVVYCGQMQDSRREVGDRDITPMFRVLRRLVDEKRIAKEKIKLVYAGREGALFTRYAAKSGLESCVEDHGQVSRKQSIALQKGADVLLMASHHMASQKGILTGKLFEYMMMDKPIVCCMGGDLPNSGVKQVLEETGMGLCCEHANALQDEEKLYAYVGSLVEKWQTNGDLLEGKKEENVESYAYPGLAKTLESWINE